MTRPVKMRRGVFGALFTFVVATAVVTLWAGWPSKVVGRTTDPSGFSAERALIALEQVLAAADHGPHPVGTPANRRVRDEIARQIEDLGWRVERQTGVGCRSFRTCAAVENLVARRDVGSGPAVVVASHTDSVPASPGAGDDGIGLAVTLELARNLAAGPSTRRPVWLLLDEGEEMGLLGAEVFVRRTDPADVGAVVNLEARGTEGPVWMFEVSDGGGALVSAYARGVSMPSTSSIAYSVYRRMPNDTDLTVFKGAGLPGVGLAMIDGGARYHTPRDDLANLSTASVQRMGDTALGLVRELASAELPLPLGEKVFFDLAARWTVRWPVGATLPLALLGAVLVATGARRRRIPLLAGVLPAAGAAVITIFAGIAGGAAVRALLGALGAFPITLPATLPWSTLAVAAGTGAAVFLVPIGRSDGDAVARREARVLGSLVMVAAIGLALSVVEPAAAYPWVLASVFGGGAAFAGDHRPTAASLVASVVLTATLAPLARVLPVGLGPVGLLGTSALVAICLQPLRPWAPAGRARLRVVALLVATSLVGGSAAVLLGPIRSDVPQPVSFRALVDAATGDSRVAILASGEIPAQVRDVGELRPLDLPGTEDRGWPAIPMARPDGHDPLEVEVLEAAEGLARLHLRSPRASWGLTIQPPDGTVISTLGWPGLETRRSDPGSTFLRLQGVPAEGVEIELRGSLVGDLVLVDRGLGLPSEAGPLVAARPETAVPIGLGDLTEIRSRVRLEELLAGRGARTESDETDGGHGPPGGM